MAWTDERLDDLADRMAAGFTRNDREIHALRMEVGALRTEFRGDMVALRTEVKGDIAGLHLLIVRFGVSLLICLVAVIAALIGVMPSGSLGG